MIFVFIEMTFISLISLLSRSSPPCSKLPKSVPPVVHWVEKLGNCIISRYRQLAIYFFLQRAVICIITTRTTVLLIKICRITRRVTFYFLSFGSILVENLCEEKGTKRTTYDGRSTEGSNSTFYFLQKALIINGVVFTEALIVVCSRDLTERHWEPVVQVYRVRQLYQIFLLRI